MEDHIYLLIEKQRKEDRIICYKKKSERAKKTLHKLVEAERHDLESDGSTVYSSVSEDKNSISLHKTIDGYISRGLVDASTFRIQRVTNKPIELVEIHENAIFP